MISPFRLPSTVETERTCSHSSPLHTSIISFMYDVHASLVATPENPNPVRDFRRLRVPILVGFWITSSPTSHLNSLPTAHRSFLLHLEVDLSSK